VPVNKATHTQNFPILTITL